MNEQEKQTAIAAYDKRLVELADALRDINTKETRTEEDFERYLDLCCELDLVTDDLLFLDEGRDLSQSARGEDLCADCGTPLTKQQSETNGLCWHCAPTNQEHPRRAKEDGQ